MSNLPALASNCPKSNCPGTIEAESVRSVGCSDCGLSWASSSPLPASKHWAKYSDAILAAISLHLDGGTIWDPYAGSGRIHDLHQLRGRLKRDQLTILATELEPEYAAMHPDTECADSILWAYDRHRAALENKRKGPELDAIVTSCAYGNRGADTTLPDGTSRFGYVIDLGRQLTHGNGGALHWGRHYRDLHRLAWAAFTPLVKPNGQLLLNVKGFYKGDVFQDVPGWHTSTLEAMGWALDEEVVIESDTGYGLSPTRERDAERLLVFTRTAA